MTAAQQAQPGRPAIRRAHRGPPGPGEPHHPGGVPAQLRVREPLPVKRRSRPGTSCSWSFASTADSGPPGAAGTAPGRSPRPGAGFRRQAGAGAHLRPATTGTSPVPTSQTTRCATWSRSATTSARSRVAHGMPGRAISSTRCRTTKAVVPAVQRGARSRRCHQVKQSPGWNVTQPRPAGTSGPPRPAATTSRGRSAIRPSGADPPYPCPGPLGALAPRRAGTGADTRGLPPGGLARGGLAPRRAGTRRAAATERPGTGVGCDRRLAHGGAGDWTGCGPARRPRGTRGPPMLA